MLLERYGEVIGHGTPRARISTPAHEGRRALRGEGRLGIGLEVSGALARAVQSVILSEAVGGCHPFPATTSLET